MPDPQYLEHLVKTREDFAALPYLMTPVATDMGGYHRAEEMVGDLGVTEVYVTGLLGFRAGDWRGMERLMMDYHDDRAFFDAQIDFAGRRMMDETRAALEGGVRIIFGSWFYESLSAGWSPTIWREVFLPWLSRQVEMVHAAGALYHFYDDGRMQTILPMLVEAGVDIAGTCTPPPVGDFDLAAAKRDFGRELCFKGYIDLLYTVKLGTVRIIEEAVEQAMAIAKPGGGFILGSSDSFREGTPLENVRAYFDAARKYGSYGGGI
jgi:uroporphyrinogen decarboxylase